jgi:hypothetical protein
MEKECPFWAQRRMCNSEKCSICECEEKEIPNFWKEQEEKIETMSWNSNIDFGMGKDIADPMAKNKKPYDINKTSRDTEEWCEHDEKTSKDEDYIFVNLNKNKESYTAYNGTPVWTSIYQENCMMDKIS